jgi:hypothetical protein
VCQDPQMPGSVIKLMAKVRNEGRPTRKRGRLFAGPMLVALAAAFTTALTLAPEAGGPGITCDEMINVANGKRLVMGLRHQGLAFFRRQNIERNFPWKPGGPPFHPPLAHWILAWTYHAFDPAPDVPSVGSVVPARLASAGALGLLVLLVGLWTARAEGPLAGTVAAAAVVLVPRVFGHGHLAGLDIFTALFFVAAVLAVAEADARGGRLAHFALAGVVWGLAMLVRLHGLLAAPPVAIWLVWRRRRRAVVPLIAWGGVGMTTLLAGWPWLWLAPIAHLKQYLGTATARQPVHVFYLGRVWADHDAPWHYPLVMFVVALPLGLLLLGMMGVWAKRRSFQAHPGYPLVMGSLGFVLLVFAWPGTPVYDGVRLFLMVFPLWAVSVGVGAKWLVEHRAWRQWRAGYRVTAVGLIVALQGIGLVLYHPCQLSHYSLLVGGLWGAEKLGFEINYWGDAVQESMLAEAARRAPVRPVLFAPSLANFQIEGVWRSSPALVEQAIRMDFAGIEPPVPLVGWDQSRPQSGARCRYAVFYRRKADLYTIPQKFWSAPPIAEHRKQGVWLARLVEIPAPAGRDHPQNRPASARRKVGPEPAAPLDGHGPRTLE